MLILVYDSETTGLPDFKAPSESPHQPHIVDICGLLYDADSRELVDSFEAIVKPDGWKIPDEVAAIHGITTERALADGIPEADAVAGFMALHKRCDLRVGHNQQFDARILRIALKRFGAATQEERDAIADTFKAHPAFCTQTAASPIMRLPPTEKMRRAGYGWKFKSPNLGEALKHFTGADLANAHRAKVDAIACAQVYFAMRSAAAAA